MHKIYKNVRKEEREEGRKHVLYYKSYNREKANKTLVTVKSVHHQRIVSRLFASNKGVVAPESLSRCMEKVTSKRISNVGNPESFLVSRGNCGRVIMMIMSD